MPYTLQQVQEENLDGEQIEQYDDQTIDVSQLPPAAVAAQGAASVVAASLRALAAQRQSKAPCTPCEKKKRLQRLMSLRQRLGS